SLVLLFLTILCQIATDASDVNQADKLWINLGENATLDCNHTKDATYFQMYWYQQLPGQHMKQIMLTTPDSPATFEAGFSQEKFSGIRPDAHRGELVVKNVVPGDKAWYFCASRTMKHPESGSPGGSESHQGKPHKTPHMTETSFSETPNMEVLLKHSCTQWLRAPIAEQQTVTKQKSSCEGGEK
uniref:Ig-like domain-containing protein n=1 Tax=Salarias fasciatus TaxID=181472 RepID=A0A672JNG1_SALFA